MTTTVADQLAFDALPEETQALARRVCQGDVQDAYDEGYDDGERYGKECARLLALPLPMSASVEPTA